MKNGPLNRRKFIKMGIGITVGGIIPVKGLLFSSDKDVESDFNFRGNPHEKFVGLSKGTDLSSET